MLRFLDAIGSNALKIYYKSKNSYFILSSRGIHFKKPNKKAVSELHIQWSHVVDWNQLSWRG